MFGSISYRNRMATKMMIAIMLVILIPTVFISISFYLVSTSVVKNNVRQSAIQIAQQTADSLSFMLTSGSDAADLIYTDTNIQSYMTITNPTPEQKKQVDEYVIGVLNNIVYSSTSVDIVYLLREDALSWGSGTFSQAKLKQYRLSEFSWIQEAMEKDGELIWQPLQVDLFSGAAESTELVLPLGRVMKDFGTLENIGFLQVNLSGSRLLESIAKVSLGQTGKFIVTDADGTVMIDDELANVGGPVASRGMLEDILNRKLVEFEYTESGILHYGVKQRLANGWLLVGSVPVNEMTEQLDKLRNRIVFSFILITVIAALIGLLFARRVTKPVHELTKQMKLVQEGDFHARTEVHSKDEIGLMSKHFNLMLQRIEQLMEQVREEQNQKQAAELRAVTHRINPHFLFNTLSTIRWLIRYDQNDRAYEGISALTRLLEANMGKKGQFITIGEELDFIEKFLAILELRYELRFRLHMDIDPRAAVVHIPRMLLQPLVENAIFHGFVPRNIAGEIQIVVRLPEHGRLHMTVRDNGIGMDTELVERMNRPEFYKDEAGIGLRHVYECMQLYFANGSGLSVSSAPGAGTTFELRMVLKEGGESDVQGDDRGR